jgi:23S rRNA U2552 (ribose-2'-O)-methylase RlmE/FtsJ
MLSNSKSIQLKYKYNDLSYNIDELLKHNYIETQKEDYYTQLLLSNINYYKNILCKNSNWKILKKLINNYELLNIVLYYKNQSIVYYKPLSRSFYKLWEIIYDYNILNINNLTNTKNINVFCMAEAPGGFIDAFMKVFYNKKYHNYTLDAISLIEKNTNIPTWNYIYNKIKYHNNINIIEYNNGDLYKTDTIKYCVNYCKKNNKKYDIITADGGFDFSNDYENQELSFTKLFYSEVLTAISLQKEGGTFICKCFDLNILLTQKILYILYILYDNIIFTKPSISRITNSEKYIIAKGFKGIDKNILEKFYNILDKWDNNLNYNLPQNYINNINKINHHYLLKEYECYKMLDQLNNNLNETKIKQLIKTQISKSTLFCKKYHLSVNLNSDFLILTLEELYNKYYKN